MKGAIKRGVNFRLTDALRKRLEQEAVKANRTLSAEIELRLLQSLGMEITK